jgi:hypothetical protein
MTTEDQIRRILHPGAHEPMPYNPRRRAGAWDQGVSMTRDDIIRMAREAGWSGLVITYNDPTGKADWQMVKERLTVPVTMEQIERFAALVAADEREACAALLEANGMRCGEESLSRLILETNAAAIRARTP